MHPLLSCLGLAVAYVAPFYLRPKRSRNMRETVVFRMSCTCVTSSAAWVPLWLELAKSVSHMACPAFFLRASWRDMQWSELVVAALEPASCDQQHGLGASVAEGLPEFEHHHPGGAVLTKVMLDSALGLWCSPASQQSTTAACPHRLGTGHAETAGHVLWGPCRGAAERLRHVVTSVLRPLSCDSSLRHTLGTRRVRLEPTPTSLLFMLRGYALVLPSLPLCQQARPWCREALLHGAAAGPD